MSWAFKILRRTVVRELARHNKANRSYKSYGTYKNTGDQKLLRGIYMPTTILQNFAERPAYIQKVWCFVLFWRPRVSDRNPVPDGLNQREQVFRRVA